MTGRDEIMRALEGVHDPELRRSVVELNMVRDIVVEHGVATVTIALTTPGCPLKREIEDRVRAAVGSLEGIDEVQVEFGFMSADERATLTTQLRGDRPERSVKLPEGCRVIAVASGKGGVGKSTLTANLAAEFARRGVETGVIDADVYGYSIPQMLGLQQRPVTVDQMIVPPVRHDVRTMSIGFFLDGDAPVMWRGPMLHRALEQFLADVHWGDLRYMFVDMPPGTGDVAISLGQLLPKAEVVVVTTPQVAAQRVAERAVAMAQKMDQRVIGVIENMSSLDGEGVFGSGGGQALADRFEVPLLGSIPLDATVRRAGDSGEPVVLSQPESDSAQAIRAVVDAIEAISPPPPPPGERIKKSLAVL